MLRFRALGVDSEINPILFGQGSKGFQVMSPPVQEGTAGPKASGPNPWSPEGRIDRAYRELGLGFPRGPQYWALWGLVP